MRVDGLVGVVEVFVLKKSAESEGGSARSAPLLEAGGGGFKPAERGPGGGLTATYCTQLCNYARACKNATPPIRNANFYYQDEPLGASWEPLGSLLGASWERLGGLLGASWVLLGASWGALGAPWGGPGAILGASREIVKLSLHGLALECDLEATWSRLGVVLGPSWGRLGAILAPLGAVLGPPWALLGPSLSQLRHLS